MKTLLIIWLAIGLITYMWQLRRRHLDKEYTSFKRMMILLIIIPFGAVSLLALLNNVIENNEILTVLFNYNKNQ